MKRFVLFAIVLFATFLRLRNSSLNFWHDEVYTVMAAKGILTSWLPFMPSGLLYLRAFPYTYLVALTVKFFGFSEISVRLPSIFIGVLSIFIFFNALKRIIGEELSLIGTFILSVSAWHITYSTLARSYILQSLLFFLSLLFSYLFLKTGKKYYVFFVLLVFFIFIFVSPVGILLFPIIIYSLMRTKYLSKKQKSVFFSLAFVISFAAVVFPSVITPWSANLSGNPYTIFQIKKFILLNTYFWQEMFKFFPLGFIFLIFSFFYFWVKDKDFFVFPLFIIMSFIVLSIFNPFGNLQPRYLSNFILVYYFTLFCFFVRILGRKYWLIFFLFFLVSDIDLFPKVYNLTYGSKLYRTMLVSRSWQEFPDTYSQVEYVNKKFKEGDIVISLQPKGQSEVYLKVPLNYILRTRNFLTEGHFSPKGFVDDYSSIPIITTAKELRRIFKDLEKGKTVWVISSKSERLELEHIDTETLRVLKEYGKVVFRGRDKYSKVYKYVKN